MTTSAPAGRSRRRSGITLTEILIAIMILGVGLVSLATLFPIGLLRLRDATRYTRSALLLQSAAGDATARGLLNSQSFAFADYLNLQAGFTVWYPSLTAVTGVGPQQTYSPFGYDPITDDTATYAPYNVANPGVTSVGVQPNPNFGVTISQPSATGGPGLPFAYDPLWRYVMGLYVDPVGQTTLEARFGSGIGFIRPDPNGGLPSAHGLQRLTNFNGRLTNAGVPLMPASQFVPSIFVSPEDVVWQEANNQNYTVAFNPSATVGSPSPVVPDLNLSYTVNANGVRTPTYQQMTDWRYSWMFTGQLSSASNKSTYDGNIVIFENRQFTIAIPANVPFPPGVPGLGYQVGGETVVEAVYGYSTNFGVPGATTGYGAGADRTVLLRWPITMADPVVHAGDWIADVTYERSQAVIDSRWWGGNTDANGNPLPTGTPNPTNNFEWDNLPPVRCYWYQVQKVTPVASSAGNPSMQFSTDGGTYRYMFVYVNQSLQSRTLLTSANGVVQPAVVNAALIAPNVVNVIPQTIFVR